MSTYEISKSSLLSLKAEILRKQDELVKAKTQNDIKIKIIKKNTPLEIKNKGIEARSKSDEVEDENLLKLSRAALEAKSKLYDKLSKNQSRSESEKEFNKRYLVRFDKKYKSNSDAPPSDDEENDVDKYPESEEDQSELFGDYDEPSDPSEEWVQYTDCLGRTRTCIRKDLEYIKSKDSDLKRVVKLREKVKNGNAHEEVKNPDKESVPQENSTNETSELLSGDMRREILRQQWEMEEEEMRNKNDIHYQNVLFNEARSHGVGYYAFSKDEEERFQQQEALKKLRDETEKQQKKSQDLKEMREKQLAARMKAARNRKRARMGLPPEENEPKEPTVDNEEEQQKTALEEEEKKKQEQEEQEKREIEAARKRYVRPWDVGKEGVVSKEHYEYTQEEWIDKQRQERHTEFAPPVQYNNQPKRGFQSTQNTQDPNITEKKTLHFTTKKFNQRKRNRRPLNAYKNVDNKSLSKGNDSNDLDTTAAGDQVISVDRLLNDYNQINKPTPPSDNYQKIPQKKPMEPVPILDECEGDFDDRLLEDYNRFKGDVHETIEDNLNCDRNYSSEDYHSRGRGVEVAPPPTFDYYGPSDPKRPKSTSSTEKNSGIMDSIEAGLRFIRQEAEKKKMSHTEDRW